MYDIYRSIRIGNEDEYKCQLYSKNAIFCRNISYYALIIFSSLDYRISIIWRASERIIYNYDKNYYHRYLVDILLLRKRWRSKGTAIFASKVVFLPSERYFFIIHFVRFCLIVHTTCEFNDEIIKNIDEHSNFIRRTRIPEEKNFVRRNYRCIR